MLFRSAGVLKQAPFYAIHEDDVEDRRGESSIEGGVSAAGGREGCSREQMVGNAAAKSRDEFVSGSFSEVPLEFQALSEIPARTLHVTRKPTRPPRRPPGADMERRHDGDHCVGGGEPINVHNSNNMTTTAPVPTRGPAALSSLLPSSHHHALPH